MKTIRNILIQIQHTSIHIVWGQWADSGHCKMGCFAIPGHISHKVLKGQRRSIMSKNPPTYTVGEHLYQDEDHLGMRYHWRGICAPSYWMQLDSTSLLEISAGQPWEDQGSFLRKGHNSIVQCRHSPFEPTSTQYNFVFLYSRVILLWKDVWVGGLRHLFWHDIQFGICTVFPWYEIAIKCCQAIADARQSKYGKPGFIREPLKK